MKHNIYLSSWPTCLRLATTLWPILTHGTTQKSPTLSATHKLPQTQNTHRHPPRSLSLSFSLERNTHISAVTMQTRAGEQIYGRVVQITHPIRQPRSTYYISWRLARRQQKQTTRRPANRHILCIYRQCFWRARWFDLDWMGTRGWFDFELI